MIDLHPFVVVAFLVGARCGDRRERRSDRLHRAAGGEAWPFIPNRLDAVDWCERCEFEHREGLEKASLGLKEHVGRLAHLLVLISNHLKILQYYWMII